MSLLPGQESEAPEHADGQTGPETDVDGGGLHELAAGQVDSPRADENL